MAKKKKYTPKNKYHKQKHLNWAAILASAVLMSAFLLIRLTGSSFSDVFPQNSELRETLHTIWEVLMEPPAKASPDKNAGTGTLEGDTAQVYGIDVGQGDSILIRSDGYNILIDGGENNQGSVVNARLEALGVETLDLMIGTHPHSDHIGGLDVVLSKHPAKMVILPELPDSLIPATKTFEDLLYAIEKQNLSITPAVPGKVYEFGKGRLEILGPVGKYDNLNDYSVACRFDYGEVSFLFTGDAEAAAEKDLVKSGADLSADILKAGHHGSSTSSTKEFLDAVNPSLCFFETGAGNSYGHPHKEVLSRMEARDITVLRTDLNGEILIETDGKKWTVRTEK